jgi:serine/threonine protein kinase/tetratricopeptide (TPR) repeat protein
MNDVSDRNDNQHNQEQAIPTASFGTETPGPGGQIGPYKLISILGEGGMGIVYLAEQERPVKRRVALKVIKPGMDSASVLARFEAEQQALALLDHPNIARVFDAGTTETGRSYFVMEYVKGVPITEHCDRHRLSIDERLDLFLQVCQAVQYAHQKGIIHRDIKPSNLLVSLEGQLATTKVIDFGIAKAMVQPLTSRTLHTEIGQLIGTPEYMSPEQAEMTSQDIDTRSDIYSLGVVLYELMVGTLPLKREQLQSARPDHVGRVIRETEPKAPSRRLREFPPEQLTSMAQCRRVDSGILNRKLRGDLDWITLKAMERECIRRYASVGELIADIGRHMHCEPVVAGPPSTIYRLEKFVRRNKALVTGLATVLVVLIAGVVATSSFAILAERQRQTSQAVADFLTRDLLGLVDPNEARGSEVSVRYILDGASRNLEGKFVNEPRVEASIRQALGDTYVKLGEWRLARPHFERIIDIHRRCLGEEAPATLDAMAVLAWIYIAEVQFDQAERLTTRVWKIKHRVLGAKDPLTLASKLQLALVYMYWSKFDRAEPIMNEVLETSRRYLGETHEQTIGAMCGLASLYMFQKRMDEARALLAEALAIQERSGVGRQETTLSLTGSMAMLYAEQGRHEEAQAMAVKALKAARRAFGDEHLVTLDVLSTLGLLYQKGGRGDEAVSLHVEALETSQRVFGEDYPLTIRAMDRLGTLYLNQGRYAEAEPLLLKYQRARRESLGADHPVTVMSIKTLIRLYEAWNKPEKAKEWRAKLTKTEGATE